MAFCHACGAELSTGARFCPSCGAAQATGCRSCGTELPSGARFCPACGAAQDDAPAAVAAPPAPPLRAPPPLPPQAVPAAPAAASLPVESRRTVTMLFCDVTGSTAMGESLDPESMRQVMSQYFDTLRTVIDRHGGTVEKFVGDAIMAAFGIPVLHEDDALRAVRAAAEMRDALADLNTRLVAERGVTIHSRTGIFTGEVVAGDTDTGSTFATGDTVNTAARLEQAAQPGEVLIGASTYRLVRDAVDVEEVEPLSLKGKAEPLPAYRLLAVTRDAPGLERRLSSPIVGREQELAQLEEAFTEAVAQRVASLVTLVAPAGTGKSRLELEFVESLSGRATVVQGRCVPYGQGITYFPVSLVVKQLAGIEEGETRAEAREKLVELLAGVTEGDVVGARLEAALGIDDVPARPEEISWAVRRLFEAAAAEQPLVVVFDDIHWAEPTFLDLVEYVLGFSRSAPILVLCATRPDLSDTRPDWGRQPGSRSIVLPPLGRADCERLILNLLGEDGMSTQTRTQIIDAAEGNPLFVEEMLRMLVDEGLVRHGANGWELDRELTALDIPPSIEALLAARLDRLLAGERNLMQRASVIGRIFGVQAVAHLTPPEEAHDVGAGLQSLVRKDLVLPDAAAIGGEDAFRFAHILIRDAAYRGVPKEARADLHERFAVWLEQRAGERASEYEEILGYHFEQAAQYRQELGTLSDAARLSAERGSSMLESAGRRALLRGDLHAAANLLGRAVALRGGDDAARLDVLMLFGRVLLQMGGLEEAEAAFDEAYLRAGELDEPVRAMRAQVDREYVLLRTDPGARTEQIEQLVHEALPTFERGADALGLARAWRLRGEADRLLCRFGENAAALQKALEFARAAGDEREEIEVMVWLGTSVCYGPTPVEEAIATVEGMLERHRGMRWVESAALAMLAYLEGRRGRFDEARSLYGRSRAIVEELGMSFILANRAVVPASVELLAGDLEAAESELRSSYELLLETGEQETRSTVAAMLADVVYEQGRLDDAETFARTAEELASADDVGSQVYWRTALAKVLAQRDEDETAVALAREAVRRAAATDFLSLHGDALLALADVLRLLGRGEEATPYVEEARRLYALKGDAASAARAERALAALAQA